MVQEDDKPNGWVLLAMFIIVMALVILLSSVPCSHGRHAGECGREYRNGKQGVVTCHCTKDHY